MQKYFIFTLLLLVIAITGCGSPTPVDRPTSNPVENTEQEQKAEDLKAGKLTNDASEAAK